MKRLLLISIGLITIFACMGQKVSKVSATYTYYAPETMSVEEAKRTALERAKIEAIANEFGMIVSQNNTTVISNSNGKTDEQFYSYGGSDVKGEWIETTGEPKYDISYKDRTLVVTCTVKGKAREIISAGIDFVAKPLRNGTELKFASSDFKDGDEFYLQFSSPVNGFLSVWMVDEGMETAYRLLPYQRSNENIYSIEADKNYLFFSIDKAKTEELTLVDEFFMSAESEIEFNELYIIFSTDRYNLPLTKKGKEIKELRCKDFHKWLSKTLANNNNIKNLTKTLIIRK